MSDYTKVCSHPATEYIFTKEGVEAINDISNRKVAWEEFVKVKETKKAILLFLSKEGLWVIPKNRFTEEELDIYKNIHIHK